MDELKNSAKTISKIMYKRHSFFVELHSDPLCQKGFWILASALLGG